LPAGLVDRLQLLLDAGDSAGVVTSFLRQALSLSPEEVEKAKAWPTFPAMVAAAHTLPRELRASENYQLHLEWFRHVQVPTLLLLGGDIPDFAKASIEGWHAVLPNSEIGVLPGQQHLAHYTAPDLFVRTLQTFLVGPEHEP
jgi:pimeloyl-ACP methyl ester carboxylesterase